MSSNQDDIEQAREDLFRVLFWNVGVSSTTTQRVVVAIEQLVDGKLNELMRKLLRDKPCPICGGIEGCDHSASERSHAALELANEDAPLPDAS